MSKKKKLKYYCTMPMLRRYGAKYECYVDRNYSHTTYIKGLSENVQAMLNDLYLNWYRFTIMVRPWGVFLFFNIKDKGKVCKYTVMNGPKKSQLHFYVPKLETRSR